MNFYNGCKQNESYYLIFYNPQADVVRLLAEWYDSKYNVKLGEWSIPASSVLSV